MCFYFKVNFYVIQNIAYTIVKKKRKRKKRKKERNFRVIT
jgi:hypothetical protein